MAKLQIKSEKPILFGGIFMVMENFLCIAIGFFGTISEWGETQTQKVSPTQTITQTQTPIAMANGIFCENIVHQSNNQVYNCVFGGGCPEWEKLSVISLSVFFLRTKKSLFIYIIYIYYIYK